jgi:hypothetical protein
MKILWFVLAALALHAQPISRSLNDINWMQFQELIPAKI